MSYFKSMELKKISILEWLENYNLEDFHYLIFLDTFGNTKHSDLLTNIKTNIDLLFSFNTIDDFLESITIPVQKKLSEKYNPELIIKKQDTVLKQFSRAFELLQYQKKEYKSMLSVFGIDPSKEKYVSTPPDPSSDWKIMSLSSTRFLMYKSPVALSI